MTARECKLKYPVMWDTVYRSVMRESMPDYEILFLRTAHNAAYNACMLLEEMNAENKIENSCK